MPEMSIVPTIAQHDRAVLERTTRLLRWLWVGFPWLRRFLARSVGWSRGQWDGQAWHAIGSRIFGDRTALALDSEGHIVRVRPSQFVDLTALFGRPDESRVAQVVRALHPGAVFVDAGAHIGRYTLMAADRVGETGVVLALEPDAGNFALLCENASLNRITCIRARNLALGRENGTAELTCGDDSATNTLHPEWLSMLQPGDNFSARPRQTVTVRRLDTVLGEERLEKVDLLKIDVEGAEMDVLEGAQQSLERGQVRAILCEVHQPIVRLFDLVIYLGRLGYKVEDLGHSEIYAHF